MIAGQAQVESMASPPDQLATEPAGMPPPGVEPNFDAKAPVAPVYHAIGAFLITTMLAAVFLRNHTQVAIVKKYQLMDRMITASFSVAILC